MFEEKIEVLNQLLESKQGVFDKRTYTVDEIQDILSISKPSAYNLVKQYSVLFVSAALSEFLKRALMNGWMVSYKIYIVLLWGEEKLF